MEENFIKVKKNKNKNKEKKQDKDRTSKQSISATNCPEIPMEERKAKEATFCSLFTLSQRDGHQHGGPAERKHNRKCMATAL